MSQRGSFHQSSSGSRLFANTAAAGGMTIATTHIPIAAGTDTKRTTPQARTNSPRQTPIITK